MKLLTANRLTDGLVIWYASDAEWPAGWVEDAAQATRLEDAEAEALLAQWQPRETEVVGAYLVPLIDDNTPVQREYVREHVRANGPSIGPTVLDTAKTHNRSEVF